MTPTPTPTFVCSICGEASVSICVYCTKDACPNHLCDHCARCSDCCECDIRLDEHSFEPELDATTNGNGVHDSAFEVEDSAESIEDDPPPEPLAPE